MKDFVSHGLQIRAIRGIGNIRLSYAKNATTNELDIIDRNDYYPFGMNFVQGAEFSAISSPLNYKFQEQELQETGFYSFKWRNYDPTIGRFFNVDPLSEKYAYQSHYNFSENRVVNSREIEGLEAFDNYDDPYEWGDRVGLDRDSYTVEWQENGRSEIVQNIEEVVVVAEKHDFWDDLMSMASDYFDDFDLHNENENLFNFSGGSNEPDLEDRYRQDDATVERSDLFEWLSMIYGGGGSGYEPTKDWMERLGNFSEGFEKLGDLKEKLESDDEKSKDTLVDVDATIVERYGEHGIKLEDTVISVTVERNDLNEYSYGNNPDVRDAVDAQLNDKNK